MLYNSGFINRVSRNGLAAPALAGSIFLKVKIKVHFYKKQLIKKSASVIFGLVRLIILSYNRKGISKGTRLSTAHTLHLQGILLWKIKYVINREAV